MADNHLPPQWKQRILALLNAHGWDVGSWNHETDRFLSAWQLAEGGSAAWNPFNTTLQFMGSSKYNSAGVQSYTRPTYGIMATVITLLNGNYNGIVGAIQGGTLTAEEIVNKNSAQISTWGTNPQTILNVLKGMP